jgi:hypothetical protein
MTDRELMQMALDALIDAADSQNWEMRQNIDQHGEWYRRSVNLKQSTTNSQAAIEALRARLAQPEREWINLTDDEIRIAWGPYFSRGVEVARVIEALLKKRNT